MNRKVLSTLRKLFKGSQGEEEVLESIIEILRKSGDDNYYLIPKATVQDVNGSKEIDLLLLHPILGIYIIEVKNWEDLNEINQENNPFDQANGYQDLIMSHLKAEFKKIPTNVEYRVVFPNVTKEKAKEFFEKNPYYKNYTNHAFFKEDLQDPEIFKRFFNSTNPVIPNKKEFTKIAKMLVPTDKIKEKNIIPIITKDEIIFFDQKQLSVLNGYTGDFRIIRGVAGTGKTVILTNFVSNRLKRYQDEKFLILCFNKKLANDLELSFTYDQKKNINIHSVFEFLNVIGFDFKKVGIDENTPLAKKYEIFESDEALEEFKTKFRKYLKTNPIDYFLCDETQDLPAGFVRIIYEEIKDVILFIDEAQRFYSYTMKSIADVFHHPKFEFKSMRGRVKNLKNVYRTPSNIAKCAFEILSFDKSINDYYKKSHYLQNDFLNDINFVLQDGKIEIGDFDDFDSLKQLLSKSPKEETIVLTLSNNSKKAIESFVKYYNKNAKVMTMASVKGLEAQNIIIHGFGKFLIKNYKQKDVFYRQIYVLLTRAQQKITLSISNEKELLQIPETKEIIEILRAYETKTKDVQIPTESDELKLAKIKPILSSVKEGAELIVTGAELFGIIAGLFNF
ncbi:MAG: AAA family ATPase [Epsilonproteobacteria bacterium]|nr:AAA family ATPase [Campylobacterota bacterium]